MHVRFSGYDKLLLKFIVRGPPSLKISKWKDMNSQLDMKSILDMKTDGYEALAYHGKSWSGTHKHTIE